MAIWESSLRRCRERLQVESGGAARVAVVLLHKPLPAWPPDPPLPHVPETAGLTFCGGCGAASFGGEPALDAAGVPLVAEKATLDSTGKPILFSDGRAVAIRAGGRWQCMFFGERREAGAQAWLEVLDEAGLAMRGVDGATAGDIFRTVPPGASVEWSGGRGFWVAVVFELSWQAVQGSPLAAERRVWMAGISEPGFCCSLSAWPWMRAHNKGWEDLAETPSHWYSVLPDLRQASLQAMDILLDETRAIGRQKAGGTPLARLLGELGGPPRPTGGYLEANRDAIERAKVWAAGNVLKAGNVAAAVLRKRLEGEAGCDRIVAYEAVRQLAEEVPAAIVEVEGTMELRGCDELLEWGKGRDGARSSGETKRLKKPCDSAMKAWRLQVLRGINNQTELAAELVRQGTRATQGQVSKWLKEVDAWLKSGNILPELPLVNEKPQAVDPAVLEMGAHREGRTKRQRKRRNADSDDA